MFNISRIPQPECDSFSPLLTSSSHSNARKILVLMHDWFYTIEVLNESLQPLSVREIERRIRLVVADVESRLKAKEIAVPISILTTDHRDRWTKVSVLCGLFA